MVVLSVQYLTITGLTPIEAYAEAVLADLLQMHG